MDSWLAAARRPGMTAPDQKKQENQKWILATVSAI
jgi:hypothetical protein